MIRTSTLAALVLVAACSERQPPAAEAVEQAFENEADRLDAGAKNVQSESMRDALEDQADAIRAEGDARADAIEDAAAANEKAARLNAEKASIDARGNTLDSGGGAR